MTVFHKRTRMVSFRLSEQEYRKLEALSQLRGSHSVSDYARSATFQVVRKPGGVADTAANGELEQLRRTVASLERELKRLATLVG